MVTAAPLGRRQRAAIHPLQNVVQRCAVSRASRSPALPPWIQIFGTRLRYGSRGLEYRGKIRRQDDMIGFRDIDAMRQRQPDQLGIDQRRDAADLGDAEPGGDVIRPAWHEQANGIAGLDARRQRPARIAVDPIGQGPVTEGLGVRYQGGAIRLPRGMILDDIGEQSVADWPRCGRSVRWPSASSWRPMACPAAAGFALKAR